MNPYGLDDFSAGEVASNGVNINQPAATLQAYPTYPNAAGVGSQTAGQPVNDPTPASASAAPDYSSRGFNPWSMVGEANTR